MKLFSELSKDELLKIKNDEAKRLESFKSDNIKINMARGRPCPPQLDFSDDILNLTREELGVQSADGSDCRNYGVLCGIDECRSLFGEIMGYPSANVIACGSSSLNLIYDYISQCMTHGTVGHEPWIKNENRKFLAVVPGYDRHFAIAERFGLEMINIPMTPDGPDMDMVEDAVKDENVKGMFCVPKYSNPDGITYSAETVERLAKMKTAAEDFRVIWDEAYVVHDLYDEHDELANVYELSKKYSTEDRFVAFASTSKITFAGAGVAAVAASDRVCREIIDRMTMQIISYDKLNQLRHTHFYKTLDDIHRQMKKHAEILRPKFDEVIKVLHSELDSTGIAKWTDPRGGYFISFDVTVGSAKYVGELCRECGLVLTGVGATYPYKKDPNDSNIRIAPSCPSVEELHIATEILCSAVKYVAACELLDKMEG